MALSREALERHVEKFSTTTVIRVFNFIATSRFLAERLFWLAVLVGFSVATFWSVQETITTFISEPTASRVSYLPNTSAGISFPNARLCLQMHSITLAKLYDQHVDAIISDIRAENLSTVISRFQGKLEAIDEIEKQLSAVLKSTLRNVTEIGIAGPLFERYFKYESSIVELFTPQEIGFLALTTSIVIRLVDIETDPEPVNKEWQTPAVEKLYRAYVENCANFSEIFELFAELFCRFHQIRVVRSHSDPNSLESRYTLYHFCQRPTPVAFLGYDTGRNELICYPFGRPGQVPLSFHTAFDFVVVTMHPASIYKERTTVLDKFFVDFDGTLELEEKDPLFLTFNRRQTADFNVDAVSTAANLRRRPCTSSYARTWPRMDCILECRVEAVARACNCMPLSVQLVSSSTKLPKMARSCEIGDFAGEACLAALAVDYFDTRNCSHRCRANCENFLFSRTITEEVGGLLENVTVATSVKLKSSKFVYEKVDEYVTMDAKVLIASLGGNLSLYLGASFLAIFHITVFFVKLPFELFCASSEDRVTKGTVSGLPRAESQLSRSEFHGLVEQMMALRETIDQNRETLEGIERKLGSHRARALTDV